MTDRRWDHVLHSIESAERHLREAIALFEEGGLVGSDRDAYRRQMAFMHSMTAGYSSFEAALLRILRILDETKPVGEDWHAQLLERVARPVEGERDAILPKHLLRPAGKMKSFRHWSLHGYDDDFEPTDAQVAVDAARRLAAEMRPAVEAFMHAIDPSD